MKNTTISIAIVILMIIGGVYLFKSNKTLNTNTPETNQMPVTSNENSQPGNQVPGLLVQPAATIARKELATKLSIDEKSIVILKITEETWTDGCLGLGGPAESCLQALVSGFRVEMLASGKIYFYRTDKTGATVRAETQ